MFQKRIQMMRGNWLLLRHTQASGLQQAQLGEWVIKLLQQLAKGEVEGKGNKGKGNKGKKGKGEHGKGKGQGEGKVSGEVPPTVGRQPWTALVNS